jgi:hypothetical protein
MALSLALVRQFVSRGVRTRIWDITWDSSYVTGGEPLTAANLGLNVVQSVLVEPDDGYVFKYLYSTSLLQAFRTAGFTPAGTINTPTFTGTAPAASTGIVDDNDTAATLGHPLYVVRGGAGLEISTPVAESSATGLVKDSDTAATEGVAIYLVIDDTEFLPNFQVGHLEFVSPTTAHGSCTVFNGGPTLLMEHDAAAATNGVAVRAIAASGGLEATIAGSNGTALVPLSDGQFLHIADSTTGSTPELYFDEDAANTYERIRGVIVDNADEPYKLAEATPAIARAGVLGGLPLASLVSTSPGDNLSTGTVGVGGPTFTVVHDQAAAQMQGAAVLYVQAAAAGFNAALPGGQDVYIPTSTGDFIKVTHAASPAGVQVYWDHDQATASLRMTGVIVDNLDENYTTDVALGWERETPAGTISALTLTGTAVAAGALVEVSNAVDMSAVITRLTALGK